MPSSKHSYIVLATDFELEPVIEQYYETYPDKPRWEYDVICKLRNERHEGDFCYILLTTKSLNQDLRNFIQSYCVVNDQVAIFNPPGGRVFPDIASDGVFGNPLKYRTPPKRKK